MVLAARELHRVPEALGGLRIELLPAPFKRNVPPADQSAFLSFTHILARQCFSSAEELEMYLRAWSCIFDLVKPDLVLYDHSPTALVASHGRSFKKVSVGSGFYNPPAPEPGAPFAPFSTPSTATRCAQACWLTTRWCWTWSVRRWRAWACRRFTPWHRCNGWLTPVF